MGTAVGFKPDFSLAPPMIPGMGAGMDPRQMSMMMKKLGIDVRDIDAVQSVVVRTATKDYVFDKATVSVMKAQGVETWQVSGKPRTVERGATTTPTSPGAPAMKASDPPSPQMPDEVAAPLVIPEEDVRLVAKETGKSPAEARAALEATKGDLAEAIVKLTS
jgi:nascent polypeptide-associated complex subunit alpha